MRKLFLVLVSLAALAGCPSSQTETPDASEVEDAKVVDTDSGIEPDTGVEVDSGPKPDVGFTIQSLNLTPAGGTATSTAHRVSGSFGASNSAPAESTKHKVRGRIGPLAPSR